MGTLVNPVFVPVAWHNVALFALVLLFHGVLNTFLHKSLGLLTKLSVFIHIAGVVVIAQAVLMAAPRPLRDAVSSVYANPLKVVRVHNLPFSNGNGNSFNYIRSLDGTAASRVLDNRI